MTLRQAKILSSRARFSALLSFAAAALLSVAACGRADAQRRGDDARGRPMRKAAAAEAAQDWDAAAAWYETALRHRPDMAAAHRNLAVLLQRNRQDVPAALAHYRRYLALAPDAPDVEEIEEAIAACEQYIASATAGNTSDLSWKMDELRDENAALRRDLANAQAELRDARARLAAAQAAASRSPALRAPAQPAPVPSPVAAPAPARTSPSGPRTHTVRSGDTLGKIAKTYGVTVDAIYQANRGVMRSPNELRVGVTLSIPQAR